MTNKKIKKIADFLYSTNDSSVVPFRISLSFGMSGCELNKNELIQLLKLLRDTEPLKDTYEVFKNWVTNEQ